MSVSAKVGTQIAELLTFGHIASLKCRLRSGLGSARVGAPATLRAMTSVARSACNTLSQCTYPCHWHAAP